MRSRLSAPLAALLALLALLALSCSGEPCEEQAAAVSARVLISDPNLRAGVHSIEVVLRVDRESYARTFDLQDSIVDGAVTFAVVFEPQPSSDAFEIEMMVSAYAASDGSGPPVAEGRTQISGTRDACNQISVDLSGLAEKDGGVDGGSEAGDAGPEDAGGSFLILEPSEADLGWADRGAVLSFTATVSHSLGAALDDLTATTTIAGAAIELSLPAGAAPRLLTLTIETETLSDGVYAGTASIAIEGGATRSAQLRFRFGVFHPIHIGEGPNGCPHLTPAGALATDCEYSGETGLETAAAALTHFSHVILYGGAGGLATYTTGLTGIPLPSSTWISSAADADIDDVVLRCRAGEGLRLIGDRIRVERLTIVSEGTCARVINSWSGEIPEDGTGGHTIDRVVLIALRPEVFGLNGINAAVGISEDTTLSNSHLYGHWEMLGSLEFAHRSRVVNNSMVIFQRAEPIPLLGARELTFANNVMISVPATATPMFEADEKTSALTIAGNVVEGFPQLIVGLDPADLTNHVAGNLEGPAEIDTPIGARFFADAAATASPIQPGIGASLDGVEIDGSTDILPGALQLRSERSGPRRTTIFVGPPSCTSCDVTSDAMNELQVAAWSIWPGGTIEIEPGTYAGNAVISWETSIISKAANPSEVVLQSSDEDPVLALGHWAHDSVITMTDENRGAFLLENVTVRVDATALTDLTGIIVESGAVPPAPLELKRVVIDSINDSGFGLHQALIVGENVLVQDVLVHGAFEACARIAFGNPGMNEPPRIHADFVNFTCRLTAPPIHRPRAGFELANGEGSFFINVAVETATAAPLFGAQRRTAGDSAPLVRDPPLSFSAHAFTWRGFNGLFGGFGAEQGSYVFDGMEQLSLSAPFFAGPTDDHLAPGSPAIDTGIDPSTIDALLSPGVSIDGVDRALMQIDRGAHEQGN